ncbi:heavy metal translocating P-type ATPase [Candidatus Gottesmanbacteria bacterium]|nr:heavy metal translocating P-type ATPase [Candidatus Gottesmanbacteria bacterium]
MHPEVVREKPLMCPKCGMKLLAKKVSSDMTGEHKGHSLTSLSRMFWINLLFTIPVVLYSGILKKLFNFELFNFPGSEFVAPILGSVIFFYGGSVFLKGARAELQGRQPGMMTLIGMAITVAYIYSLYALFTSGETLFWELATLITIMLLGHWLEAKAVSGAQSALGELSKLLPDTAEVWRGFKTEKISLSEVIVGDVILVRPGGKIPVDGIVTYGQSDVNEAMMTGESKPVNKSKNSEVIAGTTNGNGSLTIKVTKIGKETFLSGVMRLVEDAQASKSRLQILSDRAAFYLTIIAIISGSITFITWFVSGAEASFALARTVAVLVITCPHALGLAIPLVASISTSMAARNGFLIKQRMALESARNIDTVLFDKTGTLTAGEYGVSKIWNLSGDSENELLQIAASVEFASEHFTALAIVKEARRRNIKFLKIKDFSAITGQGVKGKIGEKEIVIGGNSILEKTIPMGMVKKIEAENKKGKTIIYILEEKKLLGIISLADKIRPESKEAVEKLRNLGIKTAMITGDSEAVAKWVSDELGLDEYFANVKPSNKADKVKVLQTKGKKVAMVGDGINDAPALVQADLGVAIGAGTNVAIESAGIILVRNDPRDIVKIIKLSKITFAKMMQNLFWATAYNIIAIPLAGGVLAFKGIFLQPALAAFFMSASTVIVAFNAVLMKRKSLN